MEINISRFLQLLFFPENRVAIAHWSQARLKP